MKNPWLKLWWKERRILSFGYLWKRWDTICTLAFYCSKLFFPRCIRIWGSKWIFFSWLALGQLSRMDLPSPETKLVTWINTREKMFGVRRTARKNKNCSVLGNVVYFTSLKVTFVRRHNAGMSWECVSRNSSVQQPWVFSDCPRRKKISSVRIFARPNRDLLRKMQNWAIRLAIEPATSRI